MLTTSMPDRRPLNAQQTAEDQLGVSLDWFNRNWKNLIADHGFPPPLAGLGRRWDPVAIAAWKDAQIPAHLKPPPAAEHTNVIDLSAELADRARQLAGG